MEFSQTIETKFNWWNNETDKEIDFKTKDFLEEKAETRINEMVNEGYSSGEMVAEFNGISYRGFWERSYV